jgi:hypothetical protein
VSATWCVAVGEKTGTGGQLSILVEVFNGRSWSVQPAPDGSSAWLLTSVSCISTSYCMAIGDSNPNEPLMLEYWNGSDWRIIHLPSVKGGGLAGLSGVDCPAGGNQCLVVGGTSGGAPKKPNHLLAASWSLRKGWLAEKTWPVAGLGATLLGLSCRADPPALLVDLAVACTVVGSANNGPFSGLMTESLRGILTLKTEIGSQPSGVSDLQ